jgi:carboxypeptidase Taq
MNEDQKKALAALKSIDQEVYLLNHIGATLGWDQETYMPEAAVDEKADQGALLSSLAHSRTAGDDLGKALEDLGAGDFLLEEKGWAQAGEKLAPGLSETDIALVRHVYRAHKRATCLPDSLVREMSQVTSKAQSVWAKARKQDDFESFRPYLEKIIDLKRQEADAVGYQDHPYDALLDTYEPGMKTAQVHQVFDALADELVPLVKAIKQAPQVDDSFLERFYPESKQEAFGYEVLKAMGYDLNRGRMDVTAHPFTTTLGAEDVRITTRYAEDFFKTGIFSIIHEGGHALYEQGFSSEIKGTSLADGTSLGIHESQSRTWENMIARSKPFWEQFLPRLTKHFPDNLSGVSLDDFYRGINKVEPSLIRVEADEVTYSLHVMLRFNLETRLITGDIKVKDLPEIWRAESQRLLGIVPATDAEGVLQDVHWSFGLFGYFPTYALGNIIGAQFFQVMQGQIGNLEDQVRRGDMSQVLAWLREHIHQYGSVKTAGELLLDITGGGLDARPFMSYLKNKYNQVYNLSV